MLSPLWLIFRVRLGDYIVNFCEFHFYKLMGDYWPVFKLQEFIFHNVPVTRTTTSTCCQFSSQLKSKIGNILAKVATLWIDNEWVLIATCKQLVWSTRIVRNIPIWNPLPKCRVSTEGKSGPMRCCHAPGPSVLGAPDTRSTVVCAPSFDIPTPRTHTSNYVQSCGPGPTSTLQ